MKNLSFAIAVMFALIFSASSSCYAADNYAYGNIRSGTTIKYYTSSGFYNGRSDYNRGTYKNYNKGGYYMGRDVYSGNSLRHFDNRGFYTGSSRIYTK